MAHLKLIIWWFDLWDEKENSVQTFWLFDFNCVQQAYDL